MNLEIIERGAARIGRTGTKLHAAYKSRRADDDGKVFEYWMVRCGCGCSSKRFTIVPGATPNCGNSREGRSVTGPFAVIVRRSGSGWEMCAMYARLLNPNPRAIARRTSWARTRAGLMDTVRVVMR